MRIDKANFDHLYSISDLWEIRDRRFLSLIGIELECADLCFSKIADFCGDNTDPKSSSWSPDPREHALMLTHSLSFADHSVRLQKLVKGLARQDKVILGLAETFFSQNKGLFCIRDATNHSYSRINSSEKFDHQQPLGGDFSWQAYNQELGAIDLYLLQFGFLVNDENASPWIETPCKIKTSIGVHPIIDINFRAHGTELSFIDSWANIVTFMSSFHHEISKRYDEQLKLLMDKNPTLNIQKNPSNIAAKHRIRVQ